MGERLQKILALSGACSRRRAEDLILSGRVLVNGKTARLGQSADPDLDEIVLDGRPVRLSDVSGLYYMLNKPRGCVTTMDDPRGRFSVAQLVGKIPGRVWPVGRLDRESEGLLLLTNDGDLTQRLLHPGFHVEKEYRVDVSGDWKRGIGILRGPIRLDGQLLAPAEIRVIRAGDGKACLDFILHQGLKRQIRRMCAAAGLNVDRLIRIREGPVVLGELECGSYRPLTDVELKKLCMETGAPGRRKR